MIARRIFKCSTDVRFDNQTRTTPLELHFKSTSAIQHKKQRSLRITSIDQKSTRQTDGNGFESRAMAHTSSERLPERRYRLVPSNLSIVNVLSPASSVSVLAITDGSTPGTMPMSNLTTRPLRNQPRLSYELILNDLIFPARFSSCAKSQNYRHTNHVRITQPG